MLSAEATSLLRWFPSMVDCIQRWRVLSQEDQLCICLHTAAKCKEDGQGRKSNLCKMQFKQLVTSVLGEGGAQGWGWISGSYSTPQPSKLQVQERIQLLQRVIFCLQSSYCVCNWIRIKRSKGCELGIRLWSWTPVKLCWREVAKGGREGRAEIQGVSARWALTAGGCS